MNPSFLLPLYNFTLKGIPLLNVIIDIFDTFLFLQYLFLFTLSIPYLFEIIDVSVYTYFNLFLFLFVYFFNRSTYVNLKILYEFNFANTL